MKNILRFVFVASLFLFFSVTQVFAAEVVPQSNTDVVFIANSSIREAKIVSQKENEIDISFGIKNGEGVQTGVKYGISLIKKSTKGQFLVDEFISPEVISLRENSLIKKNIKYIAPKNISGEYTILITLKNESGLTLGLGVAGEIKLTSSVKGIQILPETCYLTIAGDKNATKYTLNQGVDINKEESLKLNCKVKNAIEQSVEVTPSFETYHRNTYGVVVSAIGGEIKSIKFASLEEKEISFILPKATESQAYDVVTTLKYGEDISNKITAHYVLQGASATIQNLSLNKDYYDKGEEATLSFYWTPSADGFPGSRGGDSTISSGFNLSATIKNGSGRKCASPINQDLDIAKSLVEIPVSITSNCINPQVLLSIKDGDGQVLAEKTFKVETTTKEGKPANNNIMIIVIILVLLIIIVLYYLNKNKNKNNIPMGVLFLVFTLISLGSLLPVRKISAINFDLKGSDNSKLSVALDVNKTAFSPEETMNITANAVYLTCSNTSVDVDIDGFLVSYGTVFPVLDAKSALGGSSFFGSGSAKVQKTPGDYILRISATVKISSYMAAVNSGGAETITAFTLMDLVTLAQNQGYTYDSSVGIYGQFKNSSGVILSIAPGVKSGLELEYATFDIPYKVVASPSLDVFINDKPAEKFIGSGNAEITWKARNVDSCYCTYLVPSVADPSVKITRSCGTSIGSVDDHTGGIYFVDKTTTFNVICNNDKTTAEVGINTCMSYFPTSPLYTSNTGGTYLGDGDFVCNNKTSATCNTFKASPGGSDPLQSVCYWVN